MAPYGPRELVQTEDGTWVRRRCAEPSSLSAEDTYFAEEETTVGDILDGAGLTPKQRFVIECRLGMRTGRRMTLTEIAKAMGISHQAVSRLEIRAQRTLQRTLQFDA